MENRPFWCFPPQPMPLNANLNTMSDHDMEAVYGYLSEAHRHGFTHRRITPETLVGHGGHPVGVGIMAIMAARPELHWTKLQLLVSAALNGGNRRCDRLRSQDLGRRALIDLAHSSEGAVPAATRALPGLGQAHAQPDLRTRISALAPQDVADSMETVTLARFSLRSFIGDSLLVVAVYVVFTQIQAGRNDQGGQDAKHRHGVGLRRVGSGVGLDRP